MVRLLCPVRGCGALLELGERALVCARGHSFDLARSGYCNLLQPQDRRSSNPGDSKEAVAARRRFHAAGYEEPFVARLLETIASLPLPARPAVLDIGCGEGYHLGSLVEARPGGDIEAHGLDLSVPAVDLAARLHPEAFWVVANADRFLPYESGSFDLAMSLTSRRNPSELRRVLAPEGRLLVALPGPDDLVELREAVLGEGRSLDRVDRAVADLAGSFELEARDAFRYRLHLQEDSLRDLLALTYRGARESRRRRAEDLAGLDVTMSRDVLVFRSRGQEM
ncbi:MAG TPA: methyltransferase domain-containing protein [Thermoanaerobaculia bacterium]|nr:methyltransferase domain-containing protein [Thermoanaerobaculia bacterium]